MEKNSKKKVAVLPKTEIVLITISGRVCNFCGSHFEDDFCGNRHQRGKSYSKQQK